MSIEFEKPENCRSVAVIYKRPDSGNTVTLVCGDRRIDFPGDFWGDEADLATDAIKGFCVNCPNENC